MAVKIRLKRMGSKKAPVYRIIVIDSKKPRDGKEIDYLGRYNPKTNPISLELDSVKSQDWLNKGAIPTEIVIRLFSHANLDLKKFQQRRNFNLTREVDSTTKKEKKNKK